MDEEDDESGTDEDFVVNTELHYEYKSSIKRYGYVEKIRALFVKRFLNPISFHDEASDKCFSDESNVPESNKTVLRKPTSEEKRFERFLKRRVKGIMHEEFIDSVSVEHYLGISRVIADIFNKYRGVNLFDADYVVTTRIQLIYNLIGKDTSKVDDRASFEDHLVVWALCIIIDNRLFIRERNLEENYRLESIAKKLLELLDKTYDFRKNLGMYLKKAADPSFNQDTRLSFSMD